MKKTLLFLIMLMLIFPTLAKAYDIDGSYKSNKEPVLNGVDCIGVDSQENIYLKDIGFKASILVYSNNGEFLHSIKVPTNGNFYFKVDDYIWVAMGSSDNLLKYSLDGILIEVTKHDKIAFIDTIENRSVTKKKITYRIKGALGLFSVWKEEVGRNKKMFNLRIKHFLLNFLFIIGFLVLLVGSGLKAYRFTHGDFRPDNDSYDDDSSDDSRITLERENYNKREQSH